ncbi:uncharacterized protein LOC131634941 [Vicia villosa]|uniref:uncharacterized protein LOC131634941 n=1 Tax=Vicia villosa TaxID=3911 RepID=UPI00273C8A8D|nr:uncharacterized protein LOC131634941 [Vicia villosa]
MDATVDHYTVLGLPSGEEGANLTDKDFNKAYKSKALKLHPDKRRGDPNAASNFQQLRTSYDILKDEKARKLFDDLLRVKRDNERRQSQRDGKRRKMVSDLERRERDAFSPDPAAKGREEEDRIAKQLKDEIARIRALHAKKAVPGFDSKKENTNSGGGGGGGIDEEKVLKVSWEKDGEDYSADKLRELFSKFGEVEDVIRRNKKKCSAFVVMATKQGAVATIGNVIGHLANPLLVLPLKPAMPAESWGSPKSVEPEVPSKLFGSGYQAFEDSVLMKLQKAAAKQK